MDVIDKPDFTFWEEVVASSPESTFYHTPIWHEILEKTFREYSIFTKGFIFEDGVRAIFPIVRISSGGFFTKRDRAKSSVFGEYGNIVSEKGLSSQQQALIYKSLKDMNVKLRVCTNPFSKYILPPEFNQKESFTQVLSLDRGVESVYKNFTKKARQSCTKAERLGVSVRPIEKSEVKAYFDIYAETISRWGKKAIFSYPEEIFHNIAEIPGDRAKIWVAEKEGKMIAGLVAFYWNGIVHAWQAAGLREYFNCCPNNMIDLEIIKDAVEKKFRYYDLGKSGGMEGVFKYKKSLGAVELPFVVGRLIK